jgi:lysophospholipase L1-like esterase
MRRLSPALLALGLSAACGGGGSTTGPSTNPAAAGGNNTAVAIVYYDENANGTLDAGETVRLPNVTVQIGSATGRSEALSGRTVVTGVASGTQPVSVVASSLPPYWTPVGGSLTATIPQAAGRDIEVPVTLPIGANRRHVYMAFGDSLTTGDGSSNGTGYRALLEQRLSAHFGRTSLVINEGIAGGRSPAGVQRVQDALSATRPAYTLILYGTNDWNEADCKFAFPCYTITNLRTMIRTAKAASSLPVIGTLTPSNSGNDFRAPPERNDWIVSMNELIKTMAREEGAAVADLYRALVAGGEPRTLLVDHVHPNDRGYDLLATEWYRAITSAASTASGRFDVVGAGPSGRGSFRLQPGYDGRKVTSPF